MTCSRSTPSSIPISLMRWSTSNSFKWRPCDRVHAFLARVRKCRDESATRANRSLPQPRSLDPFSVAAFTVRLTRTLRSYRAARSRLNRGRGRSSPSSLRRRRGPSKEFWRLRATIRTGPAHVRDHGACRGPSTTSCALSISSRTISMGAVPIGSVANAYIVVENVGRRCAASRTSASPLRRLLNTPS